MAITAVEVVHHASLLRQATFLRRVDVDIPLAAVLESLAGAACYAASTVLQQTAASQEDASLSMRPGLLLRLVRSVPWLIGIGLDVGGFGFQFLALRSAALALVIPLFVVGLVFSIIGAAAAARRRPNRPEVATSLLVVAGLGLFIVAARPGPGHPRAGALGWAVLFVLTAVTTGACVLGGRRSLRHRALFLGAGTGILFGVTASLAESAGHLLDRGVLHALATWTPYALAVVSVLGLLMNQSAFQAGDLRSSLPVLTVTEPVTAIAVGQLLFGEHIGTSVPAVVGEVLGLAAMSIGVVLLSRLVVAEERAVARLSNQVGQATHQR